jgi:hypothetical protein
MGRSEPTFRQRLNKTIADYKALLRQIPIYYYFTEYKRGDDDGQET